MRLEKAYYIMFEVVGAMLKLGGAERYLKTAEIQEKLGWKDNSRTSRNQRRKLQRYLEELEREGLVEVKEGKGRGGNLWKLNIDRLKEEGYIYISEKDKRLLLTLLAFIPKSYKSSLFKGLNYIIQKISLSEINKKLIDMIGRYEEFNLLSADINMDILDKILQVMDEISKIKDISSHKEEECKIILSIIYNGKLRDIFPLKLGVYSGIMYLVAYDLNDRNEKRFQVHLIESVSIKKLSDLPDKKKIEAQRIYYECIDENRVKDIRLLDKHKEEPFIFGVEIELWKEGKKDLLIELIKQGKFTFFEEQLYTELIDNNKIDNNKVLVLLIGYTSERFALRFLSTRGIVRIIPPKEVIPKYIDKILDREDLDTAIERGFDKDIGSSVQLHTYRFCLFKSNMRKLIAQREKLLCSM